MAEKRKTRVGRVIGDKMEKTVVVSIETHRRHPLYNKTIRKAVKYKVHDEEKLSKLGDVVRIVETRPLSKYKRWRVVDIVTKAKAVEVQPQEIT
ncbi:MAG: 30S ribosomal protein S17 [Dehalococcoidales bacterium]|nr:30S ribosomal protein S17 [Dehalococcoidales bacterium]